MHNCPKFTMDLCGTVNHSSADLTTQALVQEIVISIQTMLLWEPFGATLGGPNKWSYNVFFSNIYCINENLRVHWASSRLNTINYFRAYRYWKIHLWKDS